MYASFIPLSACFFLLFFPLVEGEWALFVWLAVFTNVARTMMSLYHVPHIALGAEITEDVRDRTALVAYRQFFGNVGYLFGLMVFFLVFSPLAGEGGGTIQPGRLRAVGDLLRNQSWGATIFWSAWGTRSIIPFLPKPPEQPRAAIWMLAVRLVKDFKDVTLNRNFRFLFTGVLVVYIMVGVTNTLDIYMITYFWELDDSIVLPVLVAYAIGNALGTTVSVRLFAMWGKGKRVSSSAGFRGHSSRRFRWVLRLIGWFPENNDVLTVGSFDINLVMVLLVIVKVIQGFSTAQANVGYGSMMADVCDEHEYETGRRQEGAFFAAVAFSAKATQRFWRRDRRLGAGGQSAGQRARRSARPPDVPAETLLNMGLFYGPMIAGLGFISVVVLSGLSTHTGSSRADARRAR